MIGNDPNRAATASRSEARFRSCQSGARAPGRRRGSSNARPAASRKRAENIAVDPSCRTTRRSTSSGSGSSNEVSGGRSPSGYRTTNPSSDHITSTSSPASSRMRAVAAIAHGAWTRLPSGDNTATRQSPRSSRERSMTMVRSSGTAPAAANCSSRYAIRLAAAFASRPWSCSSVATAAAGSSLRSSRTSFPIAMPSSTGRPGPSPFQNGILPGSPGAGETITRSCVI